MYGGMGGTGHDVGMGSASAPPVRQPPNELLVWQMHRLFAIWLRLSSFGSPDKSERPRVRWPLFLLPFTGSNYSHWR